MTTKLTAEKFRTRRPGAATEDVAHASADSPDPTPEEAADSAVARQGIEPAHLNGRQLRLARRVALKKGLTPASDIDAVHLLRQRGIDPFARRNMLELVVSKEEPHRPDKQGPLPATARAPVPEPPTTNDASQPSGPELSPMARRNRDISQIQRDITRRRRSKLRMLTARLAFFVMLPTILAGWYFYSLATPMYATKSEFLILQADAQGGGGVGGLLSGTQFATSQDSIAVQSYLQSKDAMLRLDADVGFKSHFTQEHIDPLQRLSANPTNEAAYKAFQERVKVGYDPTEGVLRMEVVAADPETSARFSAALIQYAEERVNNLSEQKRGDQMADAQASFEMAKAERRMAQEALVALQMQGSTLDPEAVIASLRSQINSVEIQILDKERQLAALQDNARPNSSRVDGAQADLRRLNAQLAALNAKMTDASHGESSLAQLSVRVQMAQADLATRDMLLQSALQQVEQARTEANRQVRYLTTSVKPVASQDASYPRSFENTVLAFLIFAGIYLMVSLTASILREQVSS